MDSAVEIGLWETATLIVRSGSTMILATAAILGTRALWIWMASGSAEN